MAARPDDDELFSAAEVFLYTLAGLDEASISRAASWGLDKPAATARVVVVARGTALAIQVLSVGGSEAPSAPGGAAGLVPGGSAAPAPAQPAAAPKAGGRLLAIVVADLPYGEQARARSGDPTARLEWFVDKANDSSRYFVLRVRRGSTTARVGLGFRERHIAYAFQEAINDHVARCERHAGGEAAAIGAATTEAEAEAAAAAASARAMEALEKEVGGVSLGEGATIHLSLGSATKRDGPGRRHPKSTEGATRKLGAPRSAVLSPPRSAVQLAARTSAPASAGSAAKPAVAPAASAADSAADSAAEGTLKEAQPASASEAASGGEAGDDCGDASSDDFGDFG